MKIVNLTQHDNLTADQIEAGCFQPNDEVRKIIKELITFDKKEDCERLEMERRAHYLASMAAEVGATHAMIGGAMFFQGTLSRALREQGIVPVAAFSSRSSKDEIQSDGTVKTVSVFKFAGFVESW